MPTRRYAEGTAVPIERSRSEIERLLARHKATGFMYGSQADRAMIAFEMGGRRYRMDVRYPPLSDLSEKWVANQYMKGRTRTREEALEKEKQRLWRALHLLVKAKLEAVADGIATLEEELMPYTVMPSGETVGEWLEPQIAEVYRTGKMPPMLPGARARQLPGRIIESEGGR